MIQSSTRLQDTLNHRPTDRPPVWMMRQAGRYLPEYQAIRKQAGDFLTLCKTPELACEVTLQPLRRFNLDAAILFSDILTIPDAMGLGLHFSGEGPAFTQPIRNLKAIKNLPQDVTSSTEYVSQALQHINKALAGTLPVLGFSGSPWTLATYMVEGKLSKSFIHIKGLRYHEPQALHQLLATLTQCVIHYCKQQIEQGVTALMLFDTWGNLLTEPDYCEFSLPYLKQITEALHPTPIIVFTKGNRTQLLNTLPCQGISIDWTTTLTSALEKISKDKLLQGNFDPTLLLGNPEHYPELVAKTLANTPPHRLIINLGHGILPETPPEHVSAWLAAIDQYYGIQS